MSTPPADIDAIATAFEFFRSVVSPTLVIAALAWLWNASSKVKGFEVTQKLHQDDINLHKEELKELKAARASTDAKLAGQPTKEDLNEVARQLQSQMQAGFSQIFTLIGERRS